MGSYSFWNPDESTTSVPHIPHTELDTSKHEFVDLHTGKSSIGKPRTAEGRVRHVVSVPSQVLQHLVLMVTAAVTLVYSSVDGLFDGISWGVVWSSVCLYVMQLVSDIILTKNKTWGSLLTADYPGYLIFSLVGYAFCLSVGWLIYVNLYPAYLSDSAGLAVSVFLVVLSVLILLSGFVRLIKRLLEN